MATAEAWGRGGGVVKHINVNVNGAWGGLFCPN